MEYPRISNRDVKSYDLAIVELNERIFRIIEENGILKAAIDKIETFGTDYTKMTEEQQYELGSYLNLMNASTHLLVNPILGLLPKYTDDDLKRYINDNGKVLSEKTQNVIISFANLLYTIYIDSTDRKLLWKSFRKNKKFLEAVNMTKQEFTQDIIDTTVDALFYQQKNKKR